MIVTRECDYAIRLLMVLSNGELQTAAEVSKKGMVPQTFAYKILKKLERGKLITITRGITGGCRLTADLSKVTLYDLIETVEGEEGLSLHINACNLPGFVCELRQKNHGQCSVHDTMEEIQEIIRNELRSRSLAEIYTRPAVANGSSEKTDDKQTDIK